MVALNTLELLVAEKATTAAESVEAIHSAVALPVDEILNDAVNVMERYIGHQPDVVERLQQILRNARDIKQVIQKVGQSLAPVEAQVPPALFTAPKTVCTCVKTRVINGLSKIVGIGALIEKLFEGGREALKPLGVPIHSLACITAMEGDKVVFGSPA